MFEFKELTTETFETKNEKIKVLTLENAFYKMRKIEKTNLEKNYSLLDYEIFSKEEMKMPQIYISRDIRVLPKNKFDVSVSTTGFSNGDIEFVEDYAQKLLLACNTAKEIEKIISQ